MLDPKTTLEYVRSENHFIENVRSKKPHQNMLDPKTTLEYVRSKNHFRIC